MTQNTMYDTVKEAFAPVNEAIKNFQRLPATSSSALPATPRSVPLTSMPVRRR